MSTVVLEKMKDLLQDEDHWTKGSYARRSKDPNEQGVEIENPEATCWCLEGAYWKIKAGIDQASWSVAEQEYQLVWNCIEEKLGQNRGMISFNDDDRTTHADVIGVLECAITKATASGQNS